MTATTVPAAAVTSTGSRPSLGRLIAIETRLFLREPVGLIFVVAFPALTALIIGGSFEPDDPAFGGAAPSDYYVAAYLGVVLAAVGLVMLPGHLATYRERGVLRRFDASPFPPWALPVAWMVVATGLTGVGIVSLAITIQVAFGLPGVVDPVGSVLAVALATFAFVNVGVLLGLLLPNARAAQGVGLALFFPSFLLGGAGPPPDVMPTFMRSVSELIPTSHAVQSIQHQWLGIGGSTTGDTIFLATLGMVSLLAWAHLCQRRSGR